MFPEPNSQGPQSAAHIQQATWIVETIYNELGSTVDELYDSMV